MRDSNCEPVGTVRMDMRERIVVRMIKNPDYLAAVPGVAASFRAEGDDEGADELERLAADARRRSGAMHKRPIEQPKGGATAARSPPETAAGRW